MKRDIGLWSIQGPGWLLLLYLIFAQAIPAFDYDLGVSMGTQESADRFLKSGLPSGTVLLSVTLLPISLFLL